ncbi:unnamed protein product [Pleuronectes platessa]|uniref:Uncharacterized protein n=1 Tax=Pleuronectes platessa TaxID=8262 RepID=A0A9N7TGM5_PLEPL|nr:unnamed protein product [Pleuronectes platessa]
MDTEATLNRRAALIISPVDPVDRCTALCRSHRRLKHRAAPRLPRGASASVQRLYTLVRSSTIVIVLRPTFQEVILEVFRRGSSLQTSFHPDSSSISGILPEDGIITI